MAQQGRLGLPLLLSHWEPQGEIFSSLWALISLPPQCRSWLGVSGEPFSLSGTMGQEQVESIWSAKSSLGLGHLKLCGLVNVKSTSYISVILLGFGVFAEI